MDTRSFRDVFHRLSTTESMKTPKIPKKTHDKASEANLKNHDLSSRPSKEDGEVEEDAKVRRKKAEKDKEKEKDERQKDKSKDKTGKKSSSSEFADVSAVPNPVPDTGITPNVNVLSVLPVVPSPATSTRVTLPTPPISIHQWASTNPGPSGIVWATPSTIPNAGAEQTTPSQPNHAVSTVVITLLAVGSAFALVAIFIVFKTCSRPRRRQHPTPSLPILDEDPFPDRFITEGSPLFGGKERFSPRLGGSSLGPFAWTQYPHPQRTTDKGEYGTNDGYSVPSRDKATVDASTEKNQYMFAPRPPPPPPTAPLQNALHQAASRLSTMTMSLYPSSPHETTKDVGLAVGATPSFTADGHHVIKRSQSKGLQRSRSSTGVPQDTKRESTPSCYSMGYSMGANAYVGADVTSPVPSQSVPTFPPSRPAPALNGRSRIKSAYYTSGIYPSRSSTGQSTVAPYSSKGRPIQNPFDDTMVAPVVVQRSASRRDRELTTALGLLSPQTAHGEADYGSNSPQPTIYPDDSLSVVGSSSRRTVKKPVPKMSQRALAAVEKGKASAKRRSAPREMMETDSPSSEASATLGNLMLMDFGATSKSIAALVQEHAPEGSLYGSNPPPSERSLDSSSSTSLKSAGRRPIAEDRAPRMPSPPPIPTLAQMGLQHSNPEAYASYRSPTYSLYGLYEDGKSVIGKSPHVY